MKTFCNRNEIVNQNVPQDLFIIAHTSTMSGEIQTTYYATREGDMFMVSDWKGNRPEPLTMHMIWQLTGLTPAMVEGEYLSWLNR